MDTNSQGNLGELQACLFLVHQGWYPYIAFGGKGPTDIVAVKDGRTLRCECKATSCLHKTSGSYRAKLSSVRHNRNKVDIKKFNSDSSDVCFIWVESLKTLFVRDSSDLHGMTELALNKESVVVKSVYFGE